MDESIILKLAPHTLKRFEQNLDEGGLLFLFNVNTKENWTGNVSAFYLIKLIDGEKTLSDIYKELIPLFEGYEHEDIKQSFNSLLSNLISKKFLEVVSDK